MCHHFKTGDKMSESGASCPRGISGKNHHSLTLPTKHQLDRSLQLNLLQKFQKANLLRKLDSARVARIEAFLKEAESESVVKRSAPTTPIGPDQMTVEQFSVSSKGTGSNMFYQAPSSSASPMLAGNRAESTESFYSRYHNQSSSRLVPEQGLQDLSIQIVSPMGMNLYEPDPGDKKRLLSPCSAGFSDTLHSPDNDSPRVLNCFDLNPQCEQSSDIWDILNDIGTREPDSPTGELDDIKPSFTSCELASLQDTPASVILDWNKVFVQEQDKSPTLAQLNDHNSIFMDTNDHLHGTSLSSCGASLGNDPQTKSSVKSTPLCQSATSGVRGQLLGLSQNTPLPFANLPAETGVRLTTCTMTSPPPAVTVAHPPLDAVYTQGSPYVCSFQTPSASGSVASLPSRGIPAGNKTSTMKSELMLNTTCIKPDPDAPPPVSAHSPLYTPTSSQKMFKNPVIGTVAVKSEPLDTPAGREEGLFSGPVKDQRRKRTTSINMLDAGKLALSWQDTAAACSETKRPRGVKTEQVDIAFTPSEEMGPSRDDEAYDSGGDDPDDSGMDSDGMEFSDAESESSHSSFIEEFMGTGRKDKRFFWQYNTQSKGPKGKRLCKTLNPEDPHVLNEFEDPVFDPDQQDTKYKHNGKARRGDGNDITPNPYRLFLIGNELKKLNRQINSIVPVTEAPQTGRNRKRKEKNKYASRACRLKKKAQHEANKLTLYGLDHEHAQLMQVMDLLKEDIIGRIENPASHDGENLCSKLDRYIRKCLTIGMVAGHSADYVNSVLETVASGDKTGGITLVD